MIKTRMFPEHNYKGIYLNGKTMRVALDPTKPITELKYPEFYDVKVTGYCEGECPWCYQDSKPKDPHYDVLSNLDKFFGVMDENQKPFQVAIGGGEPTSHPDFVKILAKFDDLGITPNYTTNGMKLTPEIISATQKYCGGVAISCHPHLETYWRSAVKTLQDANVKVNFHIIIDSEKSVERFKKIYEEFSGTIEYFVLLPYIPKGRAIEKEVSTTKLFDYLLSLDSMEDVAFGANFYEALKQYRGQVDVSLYEPEIMSKYLDMMDMKLHASSFAEGA
jgi:MoaA/NifB/PqqE/SkfB family radical SAM enzyme